jgi:FKBP-type peptidyl-prolyl cis-trans isomerase FkpA
MFNPKKEKMNYTGFLFIALIFLASCKKDDHDEAAQLEKDIATIQKYLTDNGLEAQQTGSGLHYIIENPGTGAQPNATSTVKVRYRGYFTNGDTFDESAPAGVTFNLQNVIPGWTEGIPLFKTGGSGVLLIPSKLGYGPKGNATIPGNTVILFDVELLQVVG